MAGPVGAEAPVMATTSAEPGQAELDKAEWRAFAAFLLGAAEGVRWVDRELAGEALFRTSAAVVRGAATLPSAVAPGAAPSVRQAAGGPDLPRLSDGQLVSLVVAAERLSRMAMAVRGRGALELFERWAADDPRVPGEREAARPTERAADVAASWVAAELAPACGVSQLAVGKWLAAARSLGAPGRLPLTRAAFDQGRVDWAKVAEIVRVTADLNDDQAAQVEGRVVPGTLLPLRPDELPVEGMSARDGSGSSRGGHPDTDPVTEVLAPAEDAPVCTARTRTVPQLRGALAAAVLTVDPAGAAARRRAAREARAVLLYPLDEALGRLQADVPLEDLARIGALLDAAAVRARAARDPRTADQVRADTLVGLILDGALDTAAPWAHALLGEGVLRAEDDEPAPADAPKRPAEDGGPPADAPSEHPPRYHRSAGNESRRPAVRTLLTMTMETFLGLRDDPAYLDRYGPIAADMARDLARDGTWRCAVLDGAHGTVLGLGRATWRGGHAPGARLRDLTSVTYQCCSYPGCGTRADRCDFEHAVPWPAGATCSCNGHPVCRRHHRLKTAGLVDVRPSCDPEHPPGTVIWTTVTGRRYLATPPPAVPATDDDPSATDPGLTRRSLQERRRRSLHREGKPGPARAAPSVRTTPSEKTADGRPPPF